DARHAGREAGVGRVDALATRGLVLQVGLEDGLIFRREWSLLSEPRFARVIFDRAAFEPAPLALPVGILRLVEGLRAGKCHAQRRGERASRNRASLKEHDDVPPR